MTSHEQFDREPRVVKVEVMWSWGVVKAERAKSRCILRDYLHTGGKLCRGSEMEGREVEGLELLRRDAVEEAQAGRHCTLKLDVSNTEEKGIFVGNWHLFCIIIHKVTHKLLGARDGELAKGRNAAHVIDEERGIHEEWE